MAALPSRFTVFPAIDLRRGQVVRLTQGRDDQRSEYGLDPVETARAFEAAGARALHVVDLDAAFGDGTNRDVIRAIVDAVGVPVQVGGGVRDDASFDALMQAGVAAAIVGSAAVEDPAWVSRLVARHGDRVVVGIDARDGDVKLRGWVDGSARSALDVASDMAARGVARVIYTNIANDGMLGGCDLAGSIALAQATGMGIVVSGGVGTLADIEGAAAAAGQGIVGVIVGRAIYEKRVRVDDAVRVGDADA